MKQLVIGILAHVDAGKTTLSEGMLYLSGKIKRLGRVDKKDAYLDTHDLERDRGITIFSKQAVFELDSSLQITLLDTPGHVDFSAEMERTLHVLDYAILVISGADGVQGHTKTLWRLLSLYKIPTFIFVNKMDQLRTDSTSILRQLKAELHGGCVDFSAPKTEEIKEELALCSEQLMETYLKTKQIGIKDLQRAILDRKLFPCYFGSALKLDGVDGLIEGLIKYTLTPSYSEEFGAEIFKISRDEQGNRLAHLKIVGGQLRVRDLVGNSNWEAKVNQIRVYSGDKYETVTELVAGSICAVTGLNQARPGEGIGIGTGAKAPFLEPVLAYQVLLPDGLDVRDFLPKLRLLEEEKPELRIVWHEELQEIQVQIMGEVEIEVLKSIIQKRFGVVVEFGAGKIMYKETIASTVEGVGHFEPLRHYAEVHLLLEPGKQGSGLEYALDCPEVYLPRNWQNIVMTHLQEKKHRGVLTGSEITDLKITLVSGRVHQNHTQPSDFREASNRAVRQGLKEAESVLLEPYYAFELEVPEKMVGKAMTDLELMHGSCEVTEVWEDLVLLSGSAPVATMWNYNREVLTYTRGLGRLFCSLEGYRPCHNQEQVVLELAYDPERDVENPTGSIFFAQGAGFYVSWDQVKDYMHVESYFSRETEILEPLGHRIARSSSQADLDEIDYELLENTISRNRGKKVGWKKQSEEEMTSNPAQTQTTQDLREEYLLVDGYNIIHAWPDLQEHAMENMDLARVRLLDILASYKGVWSGKIIVVFDAYLVEGHQEEAFTHHNIHVVFTKEAQTADQYIEKFAYDYKQKHKITVATSDGLQQVIIRGAGCSLLSARELRAEVEEAEKRARKTYAKQQNSINSSLEETLSADEIGKIKGLKKPTSKNEVGFKE